MATATAMGGGIIRIAGRSFTAGIAAKKGLIVSTLDLTLTPAGEEFARRQGVEVSSPAPARRRSKPVDPEAAAAAEFTSDGRQRRRNVKPLKPRNVTPDGEPITDEETLQKIAEQTLAIEEAAKAERES